MARAIGPKIEKQNNVAITNALLIRLSKNQRRHELVRLALAIVPIQSFGWRVFANLATSENDRVPGFLGPVPTTIAVHRKISPHYRHNSGAAFAKLFFAGFQVLASAGGRRIASVGEGMNENLLNVCRPGCVRERNHVIVMAVDAAIGNQA